jgi:hypothetical protein
MQHFHFVTNQLEMIPTLGQDRLPDVAKFFSSIQTKDLYHAFLLGRITVGKAWFWYQIYIEVKLPAHRAGLQKLKTTLIAYHEPHHDDIEYTV